MEAKFITLEGIEGSGKTSSIKSITDLLDGKRISYVVTREPGGSSIGSELRSILLDPKTEISSEVELLLMLADRKDHVEKMIDDVLPDKAKKELDEIVKKDPAHTFTNAREALIGAVEGKLPINLKDGKILPIEMTVKVRFDPNTQSLEIVK